MCVLSKNLDWRSVWQTTPTSAPQLPVASLQLYNALTLRLMLMRCGVNHLLVLETKSIISVMLYANEVATIKEISELKTAHLNDIFIIISLSIDLFIQISRIKFCLFWSCSSQLIYICCLTLQFKLKFKFLLPKISARCVIQNNWKRERDNNLMFKSTTIGSW